MVYAFIFFALVAFLYAMPTATVAVVGFFITVFMSSMIDESTLNIFFWIIYVFVVWVTYGASKESSYA